MTKTLSEKVTPVVQTPIMYVLMNPTQFSAAALTDHPDCYLAFMQAVLTRRSHADLLDLLQGRIQYYLPHEILMTGSGNFEESSIQHDLVLRLSEVPSHAEGTADLSFLLAKIRDCWVLRGCQSSSILFSEFSDFLGRDSLPDSFCEALRRMDSTLVHEISDQREQDDWVYVFLTSKVRQSDGTGQALSATVEVLLPFVDIALRQVDRLPEQRKQATNSLAVNAATEDITELSERETRIMARVALEKTNSEIGSILDINCFTVKNPKQRIFQKLNAFSCSI